MGVKWASKGVSTRAKRRSWRQDPFRKEIKVCTESGYCTFVSSDISSSSPYADATVYVGGLDEKISEALLWELFLQAGPVGE